MEMRKLRIRYNLGASCVAFFGVWGGLCALAFAGLTWYWTFGIDAFDGWIIFMTTYSTVWAIICPVQLLFQFLMVHVCCYMFGLRLDRNLRDIRLIKPIANSKRGHRMLAKALDDFIEICDDIQKYNKFWSSFLGWAYFIYITNFTILVYDVIFAPGLPPLTRRMWAGFVVGLAEVLCFLAYSGDIVSRKVNEFEKK